MVVRIVAGKSIRGLLNYNERKITDGQAELLLASGFAADVDLLRFDQKLARFEHLTDLNSRTKTNALHFMLNFDPSEKLPDSTLQKIAGQFMEHIGFGDQPYLVYRHHDAAHPHIHLVTTNIRPDGKRISIHGITDRSEPARRLLEQAFDLVKAEGHTLSRAIGLKPVELSPAQYGQTPTRQAINNIVTAVSQNYLFTSLAEYNTILKLFNIVADRGEPGSPMHERGGLVYAIIDPAGKRVGVPIKASILSYHPTLKYLEDKFIRNGEKRLALRDSLKNKIDFVFTRGRPASVAELTQALDALRVSAVFRQNDAGRIYGVSFVDHEQHVVFKGSDLGKAYTTNALLKRLTQSSQSKKLTAPSEGNRKSLTPGPVAPKGLMPTPEPGRAKSGFSPELSLPKTNDYLPVLPKTRRKKKKSKQVS